MCGSVAGLNVRRLPDRPHREQGERLASARRGGKRRRQRNQADEWAAALENNACNAFGRTRSGDSFDVLCRAGADTCDARVGATLYPPRRSYDPARSGVALSGRLGSPVEVPPVASASRGLFRSSLATRASSGAAGVNSRAAWMRTSPPSPTSIPSSEPRPRRGLDASRVIVAGVDPGKTINATLD